MMTLGYAITMFTQSKDIMQYIEKQAKDYEFNLY